MDRGTFATRLVAAAGHAVRFARGMVREVLPEEVAFLVYPNQSCDEQPRVGDEAVFPGEGRPDGEYLGPWTAERVTDFLWRAGRVPEWIDAAVWDVEGHRTLISLRCCGRFTALDDLRYHRRNGLPPFAIKSPDLPPDWEGTDPADKFTLRWRQNRR